MSTLQPAQDTITLSASAVVYFALKRAAHFLFFSVVCALMVFTIVYGQPTRGVHVGAPPPHQAEPVVIHVQSGTLASLALFVLGIFLVILAVQIAYNYFLVSSYSIEMRKDGLALHYGVFNTNNEVLLFSKIQDIAINCNILERLMGLSTLTVQNAMGKPEVIPGLEADTAEGLREQILEHVGRTGAA